MLLAVLGATSARAAQVTEVADAVDGGDPFDAYLELKLDVQRHSGTLTRENFQPPEDEPTGAPRTVDVSEMVFERTRFRIRPRLEVGIFHDLSVFAEWPIVIGDQTSFRYASGTDQLSSTLSRDQDPAPSPPVDGWGEDTDGDGTIDRATDTGAGNDTPRVQDGKYGFPGKRYNAWRFNHASGGTFNGYRQGFDNPSFGVRFSPLSNERDDTKPSITLQADYTPPFFQFMDPTNDEITDPRSPGPIADGAHRFHFSVAMSKRFLILDPYFLIEYEFPLAAQSGGSLTGYLPRHAGGCTAGIEIIPYEDKEQDQRFAIDVSADARYFSAGRDYSFIADVFREQTNTDQWVRTGVNAGMFFRAFQYFFFDAKGSLAYDSEHLLTVENFGTDSVDNNAQIDLANIVERNPYYNPALDTVGRRLLVEQSLHLGVLIHAGITF
jgi:hypothetical protein